MNSAQAGPARDPAEGRLLLALETSGATLGVALWGRAGLVGKRQVTAGARHGVALAPVVKALLEEQGLTVRRLEAIGVSLGPGSWTGLRIGLAAAKAMAWGCERPLVGVPSLEALVETARLGAAGRSGGAGTAGLFLAVRSAFTEGLYAGLFRYGMTSPEPQRLIPESVLRVEELAERVAQALGEAGAGGADAGSLVLLGDPGLLERLGGVASQAGWQRSEVNEVDAEALAGCAWRRLQAGEGARSAAEIHALAPLYLRRSDPELKWERQGLGGASGGA